MEDRVFDALNSLASKLNVTVEHLWSVLVKQAWVEVGRLSITWGIIFTGMLYPIYLMIKWYRYSRAKDVRSGWKGDERFGNYLGMLICVVGIISIYLGGMVVLVNLVTNIKNPEYWALREITEIIKDK